MPTTRQQKVEATVQGLRAYWNLGQTLRPQASPNTAADRGVVAAEAQLPEMNQDYFSKARKFATMYSTEDLDALIRLIRDEQLERDDKTPVFGKSALLRLLTIPDRRARSALQRNAVSGGWSTARLDAVLGKRYGSRRQGGRRRELPEDVDEALAQLEVMCEGWRRWRAELKKDAVGRHVRLTDLPPTVRRHVSDATAAVFQLQKAATRALGRRQSSRTARPVAAPEVAAARRSGPARAPKRG